MMKNKEYIINPSALSYFCPHCEYLKQNYNLVNKSISAGITGELDGIEKNFFLGDCRKIDKNLPKGETIDPFNIYFYTKILYDGKKRPFRIMGKGDAIIKFEDGTCGIIDYKTSKFEKNENNKKDYFTNEKLQEKVDMYNPQLHAYFMLYSNLETDKSFLKEMHIKRYPRAKDSIKISEAVDKNLQRIKKISVNKAKIFGLVFVYPKSSELNESIKVNFNYKFCEVPIEMNKFKNRITGYLEVMHKKSPPPPPESCNKCLMHKHFYDPKKLK